MAGPWWGELQLEVDEVVAWRLGQVHLWILRRRREWRVGTRRDQGAGLAQVERVDASSFPSDDDLEVVRFGFEQTTRRLRLTPVLAPRAVVCRPELPFVVHPGVAVTALVSTPLWLRLAVDGVDVLHELDLHRPSGTWFGPDTLQGQLCFASRTKLRLDPDEFRHDPVRAATRVHIEHHGEQPLRVAQIKVPVPVLSLASTTSGQLWTESLRLGSSETGLVAADVADLPAEVRKPVVAGPREPRDSLKLHRALAQFFG